MSVIGRTREEHVFSVDFSRKQHRVPIERKERILKPDKCLEIPRPRHTDRRAVHILAPDQVIRVLHLDKSRIIGISRHEIIAVLVNKTDFFFVKCPTDRITASAQIDCRNAVWLFTAEDSDEFTLIRHDCAVENSGHAFDRVPSDDRVLRAAPDRGAFEFFCRLFLPGDVGEGWTAENLIFSHIHLFPGRSLFDVLESLIDDCVDMVIGKGIHDLLAVSPALHELRVLKNAELVRNR